MKQKASFDSYPHLFFIHIMYKENVTEIRTHAISHIPRELQHLLWGTLLCVWAALDPKQHTAAGKGGDRYTLARWWFAAAHENILSRFSSEFQSLLLFLSSPNSPVRPSLGYITIAPEPCSTGWHLCHLQQGSTTARALSAGKGRTVSGRKKTCWTFMSAGKEMSEQQKKIQMCCIHMVTA